MPAALPVAVPAEVEELDELLLLVVEVVLVLVLVPLVLVVPELVLAVLLLLLPELLLEDPELLVEDDVVLDLPEDDPVNHESVQCGRRDWRPLLVATLTLAALDSATTVGTWLVLVVAVVALPEAPSLAQAARDRVVITVLVSSSEFCVRRDVMSISVHCPSGETGIGLGLKGLAA